jgi:hypothetical protein
MEIRLHIFLALVLDGGEWSFRPGFFQGRILGTHRVDGWLALRDRIEVVAEKEVFLVLVIEVCAPSYS